MLEHGEDSANGSHVARIANTIFREQVYPAWEDEAEWELRQTRKLLAFLREPGTGIAPSISDLLDAVVALPVNKSSNMSGIFRIRQALKDRENERKPFSPYVGTSFREAAGVGAE